LPSISDKIKLVQKHFPKCPICGSEEGYEPSAFYPDIRCKSCEAEWSLFEDGMELKKISRMGWAKELLNKRNPFSFWEETKE